MFRIWYLDSKFQNSQKILANKTVELEAIVQDKNNINSGIYRQCLKLKVLRSVVLPEKNTISDNFYITIFLKTNYKFNICDKILIKNLKLECARKEKLKFHLKKENVFFSLFLDKLDYLLLEDTKETFSNYLFNYKTNLIHRITNKMNKVTSMLFSSIFVGQKQNNPQMEKIKETLSDWGIAHYLARSGLHVALFILFWIFIFRFIPINFFLKQIIIALLIIIYNLLTYTSISFERAYITFIFYKLCNLKILPIHSLHLINLACISILIYNPYQLFFLDFQLSFASTYALIIFNDVQNYLKRENK